MNINHSDDAVRVSIGKSWEDLPIKEAQRKAAEINRVANEVRRGKKSVARPHVAVTHGWTDEKRNLLRLMGLLSFDIEARGANYKTSLLGLLQHAHELAELEGFQTPCIVTGVKQEATPRG